MNSDRTLLTNCNVIPGDGSAPLLDVVVAVADGRITGIGPASETESPENAGGVDTVDLGGRYVTAGLFNMHTHFSLALPGELGHAIDRMTPHELAYHMADGARRTLRAGTTTVRCVAERDGADFALRDAITTGKITGPRIFTAGKAIVCTSGHGHGHNDTIECDGVAEFRKGTRSQIGLGADLIKVMISGGIAGQHEAIATSQLMADELEAVITTAHDWGRKVTAHAGPAIVIAQAVRAGLDCVEHGYQLDAEVVKMMADNGVSLVPTLGVTRCDDFLAQMGAPCWMRQRSAEAAKEHLAGYQLALDAGVDILLGSDIPPFWTVDGTSATVRELEYMVEGGLDLAGALHAATLGPARWLGVDDQLGTVEVGKRADLVALDANPLADVSAWRALSFVMSDGIIERNER